MNNLDFNLSPPDISPAIKLHRFFLSSFVGFRLRSTPGPERIQRNYIVILSTISVFGIFGLPCLISGIQKRISSSPNAIKLIVFSFIRISLAYTELKRIYEGFLFSYSKSHCYVPLKLWILVWVSVLAFGPVPSLVYGLLGFYPAWRLSDPICKCTVMEEKEDSSKVQQEGSTDKNST
ncbi:hypothetical protein E1A91_D13G281300v1 [Gossypium mustelinum]|uniref:Uncharacterized protein n=1 Tax=Gossypium mustelinum TaxID=34275 RepID=A0A5D2S7L9_GOSMU|nr:hypothetical protein E1A91_D13G281300v1 [Gossypium mustelinum]